MSKSPPVFLEIGESAYLARRVELAAFGPIPRRPAVLVEHGDGRRYQVDTIPGLGHGCTCPDYRYRKALRAAGGCKHIRALRGAGLVDPVEPSRGGPEAEGGPLAAWIVERAELAAEDLAASLPGGPAMVRVEAYAWATRTLDDPHATPAERCLALSIYRDDSGAWSGETVEVPVHRARV